MSGKVQVGGLFALAWLLVAFAQPAAACVVCGSEGSCYDQRSTLSGNCSFEISSRFGALVCKPKGVCDPTDPKTCSGGSGVLVAEDMGPVIHSRFLEIAAAKDPLLAAALWAPSTRKGTRGVPSFVPA